MYLDGNLPIDPGNLNPSRPDWPTTARNVRTARDLDAIVLGYYSALRVATPLYGGTDGGVVDDTQAERDIREQLNALTARAVALLHTHGGSAGAASVQAIQAGLASKLDKGELAEDARIAQGGFSAEERNYFYSKAFKARFEQEIASTDRDPHAIHGLQALCATLAAPAPETRARPTSGPPASLE